MVLGVIPTRDAVRLCSTGFHWELPCGRLVIDIQVVAADLYLSIRYSAVNEEEVDSKHSGFYTAAIPGWKASWFGSVSH